MDSYKLGKVISLLHTAGLRATPRQNQLEDITANWFKELEKYNIRLLRVAAKNYARENDRFPTLKDILAELRRARKEHKAYGNEDVIFDDIDVEELFWGIQLKGDIKKHIGKSKQLYKRRERQYTKGLKLLKEATPGLTDSQRHELERRIVATDARPELIQTTYRAFLYDNAMEIMSQDKQVARGK